MTATQIRPASQLSPLVAGVRTAVERHAGWAETAELVADALRRHLPAPDVLTAEQIELERTRILEGWRRHPHALPRPALRSDAPYVTHGKHTSDHRRSTNHVTCPSPKLLDLTRRLRHR